MIKKKRKSINFTNRELFLEDEPPFGSPKTRGPLRIIKSKPIKTTPRRRK